jgi:hypothetical protein
MLIRNDDLEEGSPKKRNEEDEVEMENNADRISFKEYERMIYDNPSILSWYQLDLQKLAYGAKMLKANKAKMVSTLSIKKNN